MSAPHRCLVIVPNTVPDLYPQVVAAFATDPQVFVLRDRRGGEGATGSVGVVAVGGGTLDCTWGATMSPSVFRAPVPR